MDYLIFALIIIGFAAFIHFGSESTTSRKVTKPVREQLERAMALDDGEFLRMQFDQRSRKIVSAAIRHSQEHGKKSAPWRRTGFVYVARAHVRPGWEPQACRVYKRNHPIIVRYGERFEKAARGSIYKVGHTTKHPLGRVQQLNSEPEKEYRTLYQPFEFELSTWWRVENCFELELKVHSLLKEKKVVGEIFHESLDSICHHIEHAARTTGGVRVHERAPNPTSPYLENRYEELLEHDPDPF